MKVINRNEPLIQLADKVMNLAVRAYITSGNQKTVLKVRQIQDIFLDNLKKMTDPKTIAELDREAMRNFYKEKLIKK